MAPLGAYRPVTVSLLLDIGQGAGLSGASGVRPFLPAMLAGALARGDIGLDFDHTSYSFLESPLFLLALLALAVLAYMLERGRGEESGRGPGRRRRSAIDAALGALGVALGALMFAGSLADTGHTSWPGIVAGALCAALGFLAVGALLRRARRRLDGSAAALLPAWADLFALALAGLAVLVPPVAFLALVAFVWLIAGTRREQGRKYEGLRILR